MAMSPGTYLAKRRAAAGLSRLAVADSIACEPQLSIAERAQWLELVETDQQPLRAATIAELRKAFRFSGEVLDRLSDLFYFNAGLPEPRLCISCGCSEHDACLDPLTRTGCSWVREDLCSACTITPGALPPPVSSSSTGDAR